MKPAPFPFVSISGTPRERLRQYGEIACDHLRRSTGLYGDQPAGFGYSAAETSDLVMFFAAEIAEAWESS